MRSTCQGPHVQYRPLILLGSDGLCNLLIVTFPSTPFPLHYYISCLCIPRTMYVRLQLSLATVLCLLETSLAATCNLKPSYLSPLVSNGWQAQLVAQGLTTPRSVSFDSSGHLLVLQRGIGITALEFDDGGSTCLDVRRTTYLVNSTIVSKITFFNLLPLSA